MNIAGVRLVSYSSGTSWVDRALSNGQTYYSDGLKVQWSTGEAAFLIKTDASITVTFEASVDDNNYYAPYDIAGNLLDAIVTALTADRWVVFSPALARFIRLKVVANAAAITSFKYIQQEDI